MLRVEIEREDPSKSATKGFPCHQRRSDDPERIPLIPTPHFKESLSIEIQLFFFLSLSLSLFLFAQATGAGAGREASSSSFSSFELLSVMNLTKLCKRISIAVSPCLPSDPLLVKSRPEWNSYAPPEVFPPEQLTYFHYNLKEIKIFLSHFFVDDNSLPSLQLKRVVIANV